MKIAKLLIVLLLSSSLMFCTKSATPNGNGDNGSGDNGNGGDCTYASDDCNNGGDDGDGDNTDSKPGEDIPKGDAEADLGDLVKMDPKDIEFEAYIEDGNANKVSEILDYNTDKDKYFAGFTVENSKANRYVRQGAGITDWSSKFVEVLFYNTKTGDKYAISQAGEYTTLTDEIKNQVLCSEKHQMRVFITFDKKMIGGQGQPTKIDSYIEAPPLTLTGKPTKPC